MIKFVFASEIITEEEKTTLQLEKSGLLLPSFNSFVQVPETKI